MGESGGTTIQLNISSFAQIFAYRAEKTIRPSAKKKSAF